MVVEQRKEWGIVRRLKCRSNDGKDDDEEEDIYHCRYCHDDKC